MAAWCLDLSVWKQANRRLVVPVLRSLGVGELDLMLLSHADSDHAGGALAVQRAVNVARVVSGDAPGLAPQLRAQPCVSGQSWEWDGVRFALWQWAGASDSNQKSCVLQVQAGSSNSFTHSSAASVSAMLL